MNTRGAISSACSGDPPNALVIAACIWRAWTWASGEARVPMRTGETMPAI